MIANGYWFTGERFSGDDYGSGIRLDMDYGLEFGEFVGFTSSNDLAEHPAQESRLLSSGE